MRTDTTSFVKRMAKDLRALGLAPNVARACAQAIQAEAQASNTQSLPDEAFASLSIDSEEAQSIFVQTRDDRLLETQVDKRFQPLINCSPTRQQIELGEDMAELTLAISDAMREAEENGVSVFEDMTCHRLNHRYDLLRARSIEINPNVHAKYVDPDLLQSFLSAQVHSSGHLSSGFISYTELMTLVDADRDQTGAPVRDMAAA